MRRILLSALIATTALVFGRPPAQAAEPPWCLITSQGDEHCRYDSLDACLRDRLGNAFCNPNPRSRGPQQPPRKSRRR